MYFKNFINEINKKLDSSDKFEYSNYRALTDNPTPQEWTKLIKELEKDENKELRKDLIKVRTSKNSIILFNIKNLDEIRSYVNKGMLRIEWMGTEPIKKESITLKSERAVLKKEWIFNVENRLKKLEEFMKFANIKIEAQIGDNSYSKSTDSDLSVNSRRMEEVKEILTVLMPFMISEGEKLDVSEILSRMNNLEFIEGMGNNSIATGRLLINICESTPEVFSVYKNEINIINSQVEVKNPMNLCMLKLYPNKGWLYNTHVYGNGESLFTQNLAQFVSEQFHNIETDVISAIKGILDTRIKPWCVLAICYGTANPAWFFGRNHNTAIEMINRQLIKKDMEIVKSESGIFYLRKSGSIALTKKF